MQPECNQTIVSSKYTLLIFEKSLNDFSQKASMYILQLFRTIGAYCILMSQVFARPDNFKMFIKQVPLEMEKLGINSLKIVIVISLFMGAIMTIQTKLNTDNPFLPAYMTGLVTRDTLLLEFSSTILCIILAGKVGSNIASEIGSMRVSEQIEALEVMGVNAANYLLLPKILAFVLMMPILVIISMTFGLMGGYCVGLFSDIITVNDYLQGIQTYFIPYYIFYSIFKSLFFAFIIGSVSTYYGYNAKGGALEVGRASTNAVVNSSILILLFNIIITNLMLA